MPDAPAPIPPAESPLREADPRSIAELMAADPLQLTDENVEEVVQFLRAQRAEWQKVEISSGAGKKKKVAIDAAAPPSLEDLGI